MEHRQYSTSSCETGQPLLRLLSLIRSLSELTISILGVAIVQAFFFHPPAQERNAAPYDFPAL